MNTTGLNKSSTGVARLHFLLVFPLVLLLSACAAPIQYQTAVPQLPSGASAKLRSDIIEIKLADATLYAQLQAIDWDGQYLLPPLGLWLNIDPGSAALALNTASVSLSSDGQPTKTVSFLGPDKAWFSPRALAAGCGPRFYRTGIGLTRFGASQESVMSADNTLGIFRPSAKPVTLNGKSCFMFWFDTDSLPDHHFVLTIEGLTREGEPVVIPPLHFRKGTIKELRAFP